MIDILGTVKIIMIVYATQRVLIYFFKLRENFSTFFLLENSVLSHKKPNKVVFLFLRLATPYKSSHID